MIMKQIQPTILKPPYILSHLPSISRRDGEQNGQLARSATMLSCTSASLVPSRQKLSPRPPYHRANLVRGRTYNERREACSGLALWCVGEVRGNRLSG
jgi:hypothetical protein